MAGLLAAGAKAPDFRLPRDGGGSVGLKDFEGRKLVVYFYPRAGTPGCTLESIDFNRLRAQFQNADTAILGVSADAVPAQDRFRDAHGLGFPLLSDESKTMLQAYGVWAKKASLWPDFHGHHADDVSDRRKEPDREGLAAGHSCRSRRGGACGRTLAIGPEH